MNRASSSCSKDDFAAVGCPGRLTLPPEVLGFVVPLAAPRVSKDGLKDGEVPFARLCMRAAAVDRASSSDMVRKR